MSPSARVQGPVTAWRVTAVARQQELRLLWGEPALRGYLMTPQVNIPGIRMVLPILRSDRKSDDIIASLKQSDAD